MVCNAQICNDRLSSQEMWSGLNQGWPSAVLFHPSCTDFRVYWTNIILFSGECSWKCIDCGPMITDTKKTYCSIGNDCLAVSVVFCNGGIALGSTTFLFEGQWSVIKQTKCHMGRSRIFRLSHVWSPVRVGAQQLGPIIILRPVRPFFVSSVQ